MDAPVRLAEIEGELADIREGWRSETTTGKRRDLVILDDLLGELDELSAGSSASIEAVDQVRGGIEILMDEIEISLGIEPPPVTGYADLDVDT